MGEEMSALHGRELGSTSETIAAASPHLAHGMGEMRRIALRMHLAIPSAQVCNRLRNAVIAAATRDSASMESLRDAVREFTVALRDNGATPEAALIALKALVNAGNGTLVAPHVSDWSGYIIREKISTWCSERYFAEDTTPKTSRQK